jgi:hypothetical protein
LHLLHVAEIRVLISPFKVTKREIRLVDFLAVNSAASMAFGVSEIEQRSFPFDVSAAE